MKPAEKIKTQKIIDKIEAGDFNENDIDNIFMKLRAYASGHKVFREIADFVAHNDNRNKGLANQALETMYLRMRFFLEYNSPKKTLDLSQPFPIWIKRLMIFQVEKCEEEVLKERFNVTASRLKSRIENGFKSDKKENIAQYKDGKLSEKTFEAIQHVMSFISGNAAFTQDQLIQEFVGVLGSNHLRFEPDVIFSLSDKITLCTLLLFHQSEFDIRSHKKAHCEIAAEKSFISHNVQFVDVQGNPVEHHETFGTLSVLGTVTVKNDEKDLGISHCVMSTNLDVESWCSETLFRIEPLSDEVPNHMCKRIKLDTNLAIDEDFKLASANA
ncbi:hypothetical protein [Marinobacter sp. SS13-12]|uniref:hypothetical protein n=1 Tax=Marinobacter sp. SS13-12 TaxID=3050451 RepID=UPI002552FAF4|nr:hypothetical protein [Marinobacter sp. SS13-12]MDK8462745.1 hypothetical protein [Marinobacter sp. SS13-12]